MFVALRANGFTKVIVDGDTRLKSILIDLESISPPIRNRLPSSAPCRPSNLFPPSSSVIFARRAAPLPLPTPVRVSFPLPHASSPRFSAAPPASAASPRRLQLRLAVSRPAWSCDQVAFEDDGRCHRQAKAAVQASKRQQQKKRVAPSRATAAPERGNRVLRAT